MSHWAELDENNVVIRVIVGDNNEPDEGEAFVNSLGGVWLKTSYNKTIRKNFAGVGMFYDESLDAFIPQKCHDEATFDEETANWICENEEHNVNLS
jgi:hypothetical protein